MKFEERKRQSRREESKETRCHGSMTICIGASCEHLQRLLGAQTLTGFRD